MLDGEVGQTLLDGFNGTGIKALGFWENGFRQITNNTKEIVILNLKSTPDWASAQEEVIQRMEKCTIRHELVHAFLNESGLQWNSFAPEKAWAKNEEMVDWFAIQAPKMFEAFRLAGAI